MPTRSAPDVPHRTTVPTRDDRQVYAMNPRAPRRRTSRSAKLFSAGAAVAATAGAALAAVVPAPPAHAPRPTAPRTTEAPAPPEATARPTTPGATAPPARPAPRTTIAFSPYVDTSLTPVPDLLGTARRTGVDHFTLAFLTSDGGCNPAWGGDGDLDDDPVARQIDGLRAAGGDVRVSFGGADGSELALACHSSDALAAAYVKAVDRYRLTAVDLDIEGGSLDDTAAGTRRARAIARLQRSHPGLDVSLTLPATPDGLTEDGVRLVTDARRHGVTVSTVNVMAMDYGASYDGDMGRYAIRAATATQAQLKDALGLGDAEAWRAVAVTPMIGVNDVRTETFTPGDAAELAAFARRRHLGGLSMWSAGRDRPCPGGPRRSASPTCSSIDQRPLDFTRAFTTRTG
ncbi:MULTISPECIES: chitinase [Streptomyces]|uniref:Chitinase n=1 Tax=Streptomyces ramulosus TaxID=47762 RepID=A0ABW1FLM5_9ACTN